jgi:hypothetical protein
VTGAAPTTARQDLERATARLEELSVRIREAAGRPGGAVEELAQQASHLSAAVAEMIPRAIAEAEAEARGQVETAPDPE